MDARKLRAIKADSFTQRVERGTALDSAMDDGFTFIEREELVGKTLVLVAWELTPGIDSPYAEVWAITEIVEGEGPVKVKFRDGGKRSDGIPATLSALKANGVTENVTCTLTGEQYDYEDKSTGEWNTATKFRIESAQIKALPEDPDF